MEILPCNGDSSNNAPALAPLFPQRETVLTAEQALFCSLLSVSIFPLTSSAATQKSISYIDKKWFAPHQRCESAGQKTCMDDEPHTSHKTLPQ